MALGEFEEHCRKLSESSNYAYDEQFDDLSQVGFLKASPKSILSNFCELFLSKVGTSQESAAGDRTLNRCS